MKYENIKSELIGDVKASIKSLLFIISILTVVFVTSCDRQNLDELYTLAGANNNRLTNLETTLKDINEQLVAQKTLAEQLNNRVTLTKAPELVDGNMTLTFSDGKVITLPQGKTPVVTITNGKWTIDGVETTHVAQAVNGQIPISPKVQINPTTLEWEISSDGLTWVSTGVVAAAQKGDKGATSSLAINANGNWELTYNGVTTPITNFVAGAKDAVAPIIGTTTVDGKVYWTYQLNAQSPVVDTKIPITPENGDKGDQGVTGLSVGNYITSISMIGKEITFTFKDDTKKVIMLNNGLEFKFTNLLGEAVELGFDNEISINYTLNSHSTAVIDLFDLPKGWTKVIDTNAKTIKISSPVNLLQESTAVSGNISIVASDDKGNYVTKYLTLKIKEGTKFNNQVICWVNPNANQTPRIKTIHMSNFATLVWQNTLVYIGATDDTNGKVNTQTAISAGITDFPAFNAANSATGYLPSIGEMRELFKNSAVLSMVNDGLSLIGGDKLTQAQYWSSTELSKNQAYVVTFPAGDAVATNKSATNAVRVFFSY